MKDKCLDCQKTIPHHCSVCEKCEKKRRYNKKQKQKLEREKKERKLARWIHCGRCNEMFFRFKRNYKFVGLCDTCREAIVNKNKEKDRRKNRMDRKIRYHPNIENLVVLVDDDNGFVGYRDAV